MVSVKPAGAHDHLHMAVEDWPLSRLKNGKCPPILLFYHCQRGVSSSEVLKTHNITQRLFYPPPFTDAVHTQPVRMSFRNLTMRIAKAPGSRSAEQ